MSIKFLFFWWGVLLTFSLPFPNHIPTSMAAEVTIAWNANTESDLDGYSVYRSTGLSGPPYELVDDLSLDELADPENPEVTLTQLEEGINYYIAVTAYDQAGNESQYSKELCVTIEGSAIIDCTPGGDSGGSSGG